MGRYSYTVTAWDTTDRKDGLSRNFSTKQDALGFAAELSRYTIIQRDSSRLERRVLATEANREPGPWTYIAD